MKKIQIKTKGEIRFTLVDDDISPSIYEMNWTLLISKRGIEYAKCHKKGRTIFFHRVITNAKKNQVVDHINGNGLDNRKENLRLCTHKENLINRRKVAKNNTTGHTGIYWLPKSKRWAAYIRSNGEFLYQEYFISYKEAVKNYEAVHRKLFGGFSPYNLIVNHRSESLQRSKLTSTLIII
ncbi:MAG: HNH endonuclease [Candidatus Micrarchaeota archaeon]